MTDLIEEVKCSVQIILNDGRIIDISLSNVGDMTTLNNYVTHIDINETTNEQNNMPVGVVSSNTLKVVLNSHDRSLFPENSDSTYYGLMDNTAIVKVTLEDKDGIVEFNNFYVSKWHSNITSSNPSKVTIECVDLLGIISKNNVPSGVITQNLNTKEAFIYMLNKLNENLDDKYKLRYKDSDIQFNVFDKIEYDNLETGDMGTWLNILSQSTLTNIYMGRDNYIKTDYCLDDVASESVGTLSGKVNITNASVDTGWLVNYTGVKTNYITNTVNNMSKLTTLNNQLVVPGINTFNGINMGSKVFRINAIRLLSNEATALKLVTLEYDKRNCNIIIENTSDVDIDCTIEIYGQSLKENILSISKSKFNSNEILTVTNRLILPEYVEEYTDSLLRLVGIRNSSISVTGFFNSRLKLGDTVFVDVDKLIQTNGYYKIIGLHWKISNVLKCTAKLVKTIV